MQSIYQKHPSIIINDGKEFLSEGMWVSKKVPIFIHNKKDSSYLPFSFCAICQKKKTFNFRNWPKKSFSHKRCQHPKTLNQLLLFKNNKDIKWNTNAFYLIQYLYAPIFLLN